MPNVRKKEAKQHQKVTTTRPKSMRFKLLAVVLIAIASAILYAAFQIGSSEIDPPELPENLASLDPEVAQVVKDAVLYAQQNSDRADAYAELGLVYEANELWELAYDVFQKASQLQPEEKLWRFHVALAAHEIGDFEVEQSAVDELAQRYPDFAPVQQRLAHRYLESGDLDKAANAFQLVIDHTSSAPQGYAGLADVRLRQQRYDEAKSLAQKAIRKDPKYKVAHFLLGSALQRLGHAQAAVQFLTFGQGSETEYIEDELSRRRQRYAVNLRAMSKQGMEQLVSGKAKEAAQTFEKVLKRDPDNITALNNLAGAYVQTKRIAEARKLLDRALELDPKKASTHINLAHWEAAQGNAVLALRFADQAIDCDARNSLAHRTRASLLFQLGKYREAMASAASATKMDPIDARIREQYADLAFRNKNYALAESQFEKSAQLNPRRVQAWVGLARSRVALGKMVGAKQAIQHAAKLAPKNRQVNQLLQQIQRDR